eukprot:Nitzschia sp. Nitz4//scaffold128_size63911//52793//54827//NITZ4_006231-RA/size63911-augustus-gene-0.58-mRNA-1//-1//CDS//3329534868//7232//frame0
MMAPLSGSPTSTVTATPPPANGSRSTSTDAEKDYPRTPQQETPPLAANLQLPKCVLPPDLPPVETFVTHAIQSQHQESPDPTHVRGYRGIIDALRKPVDPVMLRLVLLALRTADHGCVLNYITSHSQKHAELTHWIFRLDSTQPLIPPGPDQPALDVYTEGTLLNAHLHLMVALVSARTLNLTPALTSVWKMLSEHPLENLLAQRLHAMLGTIMRLVPKARTDLYPIIATRFPFWKKDKELIQRYCTQAFHVLEYLPTIRKHLLELAIDKCLEMDVHIHIREDGEVSVEKEEADTDAQVPPSPESESAEQVDVLSDKLDSLLALVLKTLQTGSTDREHIRELYYEVLPVFESNILTTYKSKFVQYSIFLLCGLESQAPPSVNPSIETAEVPEVEDSILHRDFASKLLEIVMDPYRATLTRQSGACYLASFVSRASYVGPETACECVSALLRWAEAYMDALATNTIRAADARAQSDLHSLFYTVCQAAFYIMCFRGPQALAFYREVADSIRNDPNESDAALEHLNLGLKRWTTICGHELQPLRFCLESVRSEFLHMAHAYELIESTVLEKLVVDAKRWSTGRVNKKAASTIRTAATLETQRRTGGVGGLGRGSNPLKSFFPFDPLLLRRSHDYIEPFYNHWQGPVEEEDVLDIDE